MWNREFFSKVIFMIFSFFPFKYKLEFVSLVVLASYMIFSGTAVKATNPLVVEYKITQDNFLPQNELLLLIDNDLYVLSFEMLKKRTQQQDEKSEVTLKTSRKAVKEARIKENIKRLSRSIAEVQE